MCSGELANLVAVLTNQVATERSDREALEAGLRAEVAAEVVKREAVEASLTAQLTALAAQVAELTAYHRQVQVRVKMMLLVQANYTTTATTAATYCIYCRYVADVISIFLLPLQIYKTNDE